MESPINVNKIFKDLYLKFNLKENSLTNFVPLKILHSSKNH